MDLFVRLPLVLRKKIEIYYLSYGTGSSRIIADLIKNSRIMKHNSDKTLWNLFVYNHGYVKCRITEGVVVPSALYELELKILHMTTTLEDDLRQYLINHLTSKLECRVFSKYYSLL
jgi:hypothetical protein